MARDPIETRIARAVLPVFATGLLWLLAVSLSHALTPVPEADARTSSSEREDSLGESVASLARETPTDLAGLSDVRIRTCALSVGDVEVSRGELSGAVVVPASEEVLWSASLEDAVAPASVQKILTATAAWKELGPDFRFVTTVWGSEAGELWLVGGGDPTLTRTPGNNYYNSTASLDDLAQRSIQGIAEQGFPTPQTFNIDTSRYRDFPQWDESWRAASAALGYVAPVTSVMVDGDRDRPAMRLSPRSTRPADRAQEWFALALTAQGLPAISVGGDSLARGVEVARVESAPLPDLLRIMLEDSDNTLAEALAREVALSRGTTDFTQALLDAAGVDEELREGLVLRDGSGLSPLNRLDAQVVTTLLSQWANDSELANLVEFLPIAGETGSLQRRFPDGSAARGQVRAKTGSITGVRSLAGVFEDKQGHTLVFSLNIAGAGVSDGDRASIDGLVNAIYECGENLAHWEKDEVSTTE